jgi:hypothetical protein
LPAGVASGTDRSKDVETEPETLDTRYDPWELDEQLRHIGRVLDGGGTSSCEGTCGSACECKTTRLDLSHDTPTARHTPPAMRPSAASRAMAAAMAVLAWTLLLLSTAALCCGGILLGWSKLTPRVELWNVGLPIALAGLAGLLAAFIVQLGRTPFGRRRAPAKPHDTENHILPLVAPAAEGDCHAHGAHADGPQPELSDLKTQLDLLSLKIAQQGR